MGTDVVSRLNWVDVIVIILLIRSSYVGLNHGLSVGIAEFFGLVAATVAGFHYYKNLSYGIVNIIPQTERFADFFSLTGIIIITVICVKVLGMLVERLVQVEFASFLERIGGIILGLLKGIIVSGLVLFCLLQLPSQYIVNSIDKTSLAGPYIAEVVPSVYSLTAKLINIKPETPKKDTASKEKEK